MSILLKALAKARRALVNGLEAFVRQILFLTLLVVSSQMSHQTLMCNQDTNMLMISRKQAVFKMSTIDGAAESHLLFIC